MSEAAGLVAAVSSKALDSGTYYSFCIDDIWYRTGRDPVPFEKGNTVKFLFEENKYGKQVDLATLKVKEGKTVTRGGGSSNERKSDYQQKEEYWKNKDIRDIETQKSIRMAGSINTAIAMVGRENSVILPQEEAQKMFLILSVLVALAAVVFSAIATQERLVCEF